MSKDADPQHSRAWLRQKAREYADGRQIDIDSLTRDDVAELVHEFGIYQVELLTQNEELKESYKALGEARDAYADLFEFAPVGYVIVNDQGLITSANLTTRTMLGLERTLFLRRPLANFFAQGHERRCYTFLNTLFRENREESLDTVFARSDGSRLPVRLRTKLRLESGRRICRLAVMDISEEKRAEQERERLLTKLEPENSAATSKDPAWDWPSANAWSRRWAAGSGWRAAPAPAAPSPSACPLNPTGFLKKPGRRRKETGPSCRLCTFSWSRTNA